MVKSDLTSSSQDRRVLRGEGCRVDVVQEEKSLSFTQTSPHLASFTRVLVKVFTLQELCEFYQLHVLRIAPKSCRSQSPFEHGLCHQLIDFRFSQENFFKQINIIKYE